MKNILFKALIIVYTCTLCLLFELYIHRKTGISVYDEQKVIPQIRIKTYTIYKQDTSGIIHAEYLIIRKSKPII